MGRYVSPAACSVPCLRFTTLVHRFPGSASRARLGTGCWLDFARWGLLTLILGKAPYKKHQAALGALTTQAQRPGARDAWIANHDVMPGSLQRMVMRHLVVYFMGLYFSAYDQRRLVAVTFSFRDYEAKLSIQGFRMDLPLPFSATMNSSHRTPSVLLGFQWE